MLVTRDVLNHDQFIAQYFYPGNFLQSFIWKDFLEAQKKKQWQLTVTTDKGEVIAICVLYENRLFFNKSYLYAPKGPIFKEGLSIEDKQQALSLILSQIRDITIATHNQEELFCKLEPSKYIPSPPELIKVKDVQPKDTWILDLNKELKELLAQMHPKTRYNIGLARKKDVTITISKESKDLKYFLQLIKKTANRQQITVHPEKYYKLLWQTLLKHKAGELYIAKLDDKVIAVNLMVKFGQATTYLHGASDYQYRKYMAPHLLQWQAIKEAQNKGCEIYDFWGVAPEDNSQPNWQGITRFKQGFGGQRISSPGALSFVYNRQWHRIYLFIKRLQKIIKLKK